ncbi:MAG: hypothetical protein AB7T49_01855 [Oligoflexales bacterium]
MKTTRIASLVAALSVATGSLGGTISSGGGKSFRPYQNNPWWLENTEVVTYCIEMDTKYFDINYAQAKQMVDGALNEWKDAFLKAPDEYYAEGELAPYSQVRIATQEFKFEEECQPTTDLRFQLGVLSKKQKEGFPDFKDYLGAAVRTSYDLNNLRSKGYIYIAPLDGDLKPDTSLIDKDAWSQETCDGCLLRQAILHEVGHIFGLDDSKVGGDKPDLMESALLQWMVWYFVKEEKAGTLNPTEMRKLYSVDGVINAFHEKTYEGCGNDDSPVNIYQAQWFGIPTGYDCTRVTLTREGMEVSAARSKGDDFVAVGEMKAGINEEVDAIVFVELPPQQRVFTKIPNEKDSGDLAGEVGFSKADMKGHYISKDGKIKKPLALQFRRDAWPNTMGVDENGWNDYLLYLYK